MWPQGIADVVIVGLLVVLMSAIPYWYLRNGFEGLRKWREAIVFIGFLWLGWALMAEFLATELLDVQPRDALFHERMGRNFADSIDRSFFESGGLIGVVEQFRLGNTGYQFLLGLLFWVSDCSRATVNAINAFFGWWGCLLILLACAHRTPTTRVPGYLVLLVMALPTAIFWSGANLKEGLMLWGIGQFLTMGLVHRRPTTMGIVGSGTLMVMRPHIALIWFSAFAFAATFSSRHRLVGIVAVVGVISAYVVLGDYIGRPEAIQSVEGTQEFLEENYQNIQRSGGSAIVGERIPIISGALALFLRPFPWEGHGLRAVLSSLEIWLLTLLIINNWLWIPHWKRYLLHRPEILLALAVCGMFMLLYTYIGNLGLLARQRLQALPALLMLLVIPRLFHLAESADTEADGTAENAADDADADAATVPDAPTAVAAHRIRY